MRLRLVLAGALALIAGLVTLPVRATPASGVTTVTIGDGVFDDIGVFSKTDVNPGKATDFWMAAINTKGPSQLYVLQNTVIPGGTFGWHSHPGPSLVIVKSGTATEYEGNDPTFTPHLHPAGTTFIDPGEATGHLVRNNGSVNLVVIVVRFVPEGMAQRIDVENLPDPPPDNAPVK